MEKSTARKLHDGSLGRLDPAKRESVCARDALTVEFGTSRASLGQGYTTLSCRRRRHYAAMVRGSDAATRLRRNGVVPILR
jgi:hypothetical protein